MLRDAVTRTSRRSSCRPPRNKDAADRRDAKKRAEEVEKQDEVKFGTHRDRALPDLHRLGQARVRLPEGRMRTGLRGRQPAVSDPRERQRLHRQAAGVHVREARGFHEVRQELDKFDVPENVAGYYQGNSLGFGHMAMWKPDVAAAKGDVRLAEKRWAYVLTHEFTHAFVARYRTNAFIPRWLNEGVAEVVASRQFPRPDIYPFVRDRASKRKSIQNIFVDQGARWSAEDYPVVQTIVETMIAGNPKAFLPYFNDIKDGMNPTKRWRRIPDNPEGLEAAWRKYIVNAGKK